MRDLNPYIGLPYDRENFNCWHLATLVFREVYGIVLPQFPDTDDLKHCEQLEVPREGAFVAMYNHITHDLEHVGVCINEREILHCFEGAYASKINKISACCKLFWKVEFYAVDHYSS